MTTASQLLTIGLALFWSMGLAQVASTTPVKFTSSTSIFMGLGMSRLDLPYNRPEQIRRELLDTNIIHLIARSRGVSIKELAGIQIAPNARDDGIELYQIGNAQPAFNLMRVALGSYAEAREAGHTKEFLVAAMTNGVPPLSIADIDLRVLVLNRPFIPVSWVKGADSGTRTNKAGQISGISKTMTIVNGKMQTTSVTNMPKFEEVCRWVSYTVTDGEIEWVYVLNFNVLGRLDCIDESRRDAKEDDPRFQKTIKNVEHEVEAEMKASGTYGLFGSVHEFWHRKQEKLMALGIHWRSPADLNPNATYE